MKRSRLFRSGPLPALDAGRHYRLSLPGRGAAGELALLRRRRRIATCLACAAGAIAMFSLYVLSWMLVLGL